MEHRAQVFTKPSGSREVREALSYNVLVHIHAVEDFTSSAEPYQSFAPPSDDSGFGGMPDTDSNDLSPRRHFFRTVPGVVDSLPDPAGSHHKGHRASQGGRGRSQEVSWRLPSMGPTSPLLVLARFLSWGTDCTKAAVGMLAQLYLWLLLRRHI